LLIIKLLTVILAELDVNSAPEFSSYI